MTLDAGLTAMLNVLDAGWVPDATATNILFSWTGSDPLTNGCSWTLPNGWADVNGSADNVLMDATGNTIALVGIIPEPSAFALASVGLPLLLSLRRRG